MGIIQVFGTHFQGQEVTISILIHNKKISTI